MAVNPYRQVAVSFTIKGDLSVSNRRSYSARDVIKIVRRMQHSFGADVAEHARKVMSNWLSKGYKYQIGFTGEASNNLFVGSDEHGNEVSYFVYEGDVTQANYSIRHGIDGGKDAIYRRRPDDGRGGESYTDRFSGGLADLEKWARARGLKAEKFWHGRRKARKRKNGARVKLKNYSDAELRHRMIFRIWGGIRANGISNSEKYQTLFGNSYFDYSEKYGRVHAVTDANRYIEKEYDKPNILAEISEVFINFMAGQTLRYRSTMGSFAFSQNLSAIDKMRGSLANQLGGR